MVKLSYKQISYNVKHEAIVLKYLKFRQNRLKDAEGNLKTLRHKFAVYCDDICAGEDSNDSKICAPSDGFYDVELPAKIHALLQHLPEEVAVCKTVRVSANKDTAAMA